LDTVQNQSIDALIFFNDADGFINNNHSFKRDEALILAGQKHYIA
jgi:hypothetical protein